MIEKWYVEYNALIYRASETVITKDGKITKSLFNDEKGVPKIPEEIGIAGMHHKGMGIHDFLDALREHGSFRITGYYQIDK